jgi:DNA mismatch endonuclease, patch repair protein
VRADLKRTLKFGKFSNVSVARSSLMRSIRSTATHPERRLRSRIAQSAISGWVIHPKLIPGRPDFYFEHKRVAIFVDGCFWHACRKCYRDPKTNPDFWNQKFLTNKRRDRQVNRQLRASGHTVIRFWEHRILSDLDGCIFRLREALSR